MTYTEALTILRTYKQPFTEEETAEFKEALAVVNCKAFCSPSE